MLGDFGPAWDVSQALAVPLACTLKRGYPQVFGYAQAFGSANRGYTFAGLRVPRSRGLLQPKDLGDLIKLMWGSGSKQREGGQEKRRTGPPGPGHLVGLG